MLRGAPFHPGRRRQPMADVHGQGVVGRDLGREDGTRDDEQEEPGRGQAPAQPPQARSHPAARLDRLGALVVELGHLHLGRSAHCRHVRIRGSITPTMRSTIRFTPTMSSASRMTAHWTIGKSWLRIESTVSVATPGQANTVSVMMAPPRSCPNCRPSTVITGMHALRNACLMT